MILTLLSILTFLGWFYLAFFHGRFWMPLLEADAIDPELWPSVDIIVPARDEAELMPMSFPSLLAQDYPGTLRVILVDDHSSDGTRALAQSLAIDPVKKTRLTVISAPDLPKGWSGKVAAMQAGVKESLRTSEGGSPSEYILFTDADIWHDPKHLKKLVARALEMKLDLSSRMVRLNCHSSAERLLIPAFVFFFAMLFPFRRVNDRDEKIAAAAGGVMLLRRKALDAIGGLARIQGALIDDCALAAAIKEFGGSYGPGRAATPLSTDIASPNLTESIVPDNGRTSGRIELCLTRHAQSLREYPKFRDIHRLVARTAFTQLRFSTLLLGGTIFGMALLFLAPLLLLLVGSPPAIIFGFLAWIFMTLLYLPTISFYKLSPVWALTLPLSGLFYIAATIDSARLYWQGSGGQWKGRHQA